MLVGSFVMGLVGHFEEEDRPIAASRILHQLRHVVQTRMTDDAGQHGDVLVPTVIREVGDA